MINNPEEFLQGESNFLIDGPSGHLELLTLHAKEPAKGVAIICHPHPLHEGTMHNKVVYTLSRAFSNKNWHALRFNYRGVGKSEGEYGNSVGEVEDLMAVIAWCDKVLGHPKLMLAGFSFGAYIAAKAATQHPCEKLWSIAPAVTNQPYETIGHIDCPWTIVQGEKDEVILASDVFAWFAARSSVEANMKLIKLPNVTHYFHGELIALREIVENDTP